MSGDCKCVRNGSIDKLNNAVFGGTEPHESLVAKANDTSKRLGRIEKVMWSALGLLLFQVFNQVVLERIQYVPPPSPTNIPEAMIIPTSNELRYKKEDE